jgi:hypothetical protein
MGCAGCLPTARELQEQIDKVYMKAKEYATTNKKLAVIYRLSDTQVDFMDADKARTSGITPIKFVSWL